DLGVRGVRVDVLAAAGPLAGAGRVAAPARGAPGQATRRRGPRPGPRRGRLLPSTCAQRGDHVGPSPVDRGRPGSKHHLITDAGEIPLAVTLTGGNRHDVTQLIPLIDAVPPIRGRRGRPARRPRRIYADRGYDHDKYVASYAPEGSPRSSHAVVTHTAPASAADAGSANAASPGCTPSNAYAPATNDAPTSTEPC